MFANGARFSKGVRTFDFKSSKSLFEGFKYLFEISCGSGSNIEWGGSLLTLSQDISRALLSDKGTRRLGNGTFFRKLNSYFDILMDAYGIVKYYLGSGRLDSFLDKLLSVSDGVLESESFDDLNRMGFGNVTSMVNPYMRDSGLVSFERGIIFYQLEDALYGVKKSNIVSVIGGVEIVGDTDLFRKAESMLDLIDYGCRYIDLWSTGLDGYLSSIMGPD